jgi:hypothetical protein
MNEPVRNFIRAMLHGMTGAGLFHRLRIPGQDEFIDSRPVEEFIASGDFQATLERAQKKQTDRAER